MGLSKPTTEEIKNLLAEMAQRVEDALSQWVGGDDVPGRLAEAMQYAVLGGGKRLRPAMLFLAADVVNPDGPLVDPTPAAIALEIVHGYSLVHDDLPAMDDDALRRGRPTVHVKYGEAMAILVGDALLTQAFSIITEKTGDPDIAVELVAELARAAGPAGMIAGQVADMALCELPDGVEGLEYIHARKTAAMFAAACRMGAICGGASSEQCQKLGQFGMDLGLAFQIKDDILDTTATSEQLGKTPGKDAATGKRTYPAILGMAESQKAAACVSRRAIEHLKDFGAAADTLRTLAEMMLGRSN